MKYLLLIFLLSTYTTSFGQKNLPTIHAGGALHSYKGDMGTFDKAGAGFQIGLQLTKKKRLNGAFNLGIGQISDDDTSIIPKQQVNTSAPNSFFKTNFFLGNYDLHYNFLTTKKLTIYLSQGIGFLFFTPKNENGQELSDLKETRMEAEDYRNSTLILPTSLGAIYSLATHVGVGFQSSIMNTSTDYIDNISGFGSSGNDNILSFRFSVYISPSMEQSK